MAKIICKLPNASELISGVKFVTHKLGMISEEIADEVAAEFVKIEGYVLAEAEKAAAAVTGGKKGGNKGADKGAASGGQGSAGGDESKPGEGSENGAGAGDENKPKDPPEGGSDGAN